jgi:sugar phosphate isomerase/epimerase
MNRRNFIRQTTLLAAAGLASPLWAAAKEPLFRLSLAEWSLHRSLYAGKIQHLDFPRIAKKDYDFDAIELVNSFFTDKVRDTAYLRDFKKRADDLGVKTLLILCDGEGELGDPDAKKQTQALDNHRRWLDAAAALGCHSIRTNASGGGGGSPAEQATRTAAGLRKLCEIAAPMKLNVLLENHIGLSCDAAWLVNVMNQVKLPNCGTLADFNNFELPDGKQYDRYKGVAELMPYAKAVSAQTTAFDDNGQPKGTDFRRLLKIVVDSGYRGYVEVEFSGESIPEAQGIRASKKLLEKLRTELTA